jgi:hypothetical protein
MAMQSPELELLDQLLGGNLSLAVCRRFFNGDASFSRAVLAMLDDGTIELLRADSAKVPRWQWVTAIEESFLQTDGGDVVLSITPLGAERV